MHIEVYVEEPSAKVALDNFLPRMIGDRASWQILNFTGKDKMLRSLPARFRAIRKRMANEQLRVLVLIDRDNQDCRELKGQLERMAGDAGLVTKSRAGVDAQFEVANRIVVEELEAWFFGDVVALCDAYDRLSNSLARKRRYRDPDDIAGGTWEALHREMKRVGYYREHFPKIEVARRVSKFMDPARNRSASFQAFREAVEALVA